MTHFGSTQNNFQFWSLTSECSHQFSGLIHIPNVDAKANDLRLVLLRWSELLQELMDHVLRLPSQGKFSQGSCLGQLGTAMASHVGQQVTQS